MLQSPLPQDVVELAELMSPGGDRPSIAQVAGDLALSPSQVHTSLKRLARSRLVEDQTGRPLLKPVEEFLIHGVKYAFPSLRGEATRGMATAHAAPPLNRRLSREIFRPCGRMQRGTCVGSRSSRSTRRRRRPPGRTRCSTNSWRSSTPSETDECASDSWPRGH